MTPLGEREAIEIAQSALLWFLADPERIGGLLGVSGLSPGDLRRRAGEAEFLGFVLDHLMSEDDWLLAFTEETGLPPDVPLRARASLPGGATPHWT